MDKLDLDNVKKIEFILHGGKTRYQQEGKVFPADKDIYNSLITKKGDRCFYVRLDKEYIDQIMLGHYVNVITFGYSTWKIDWMDHAAKLDTSIKRLLSDIKDRGKDYEGLEKERFLKFFENLQNFLSILKKENDALHSSLKKKQDELYDEFYRMI